MPGAQLMAVVKADAYGHGAVETAHVALTNGATALGVAMPEEGARLREAGIRAPILVLGGVEEAGAKADVRFDLAQTVYDVPTVRHLAAAAKKRRDGMPLAVHIKVDSGMGRIGVRDGAALAALLQAVEDAPALRLAGVYTHFATADGQDAAFVGEQHRRFLSMTAPIQEMASSAGIVLHAANSAALLRFPDMHHGMVRAGIAMYVDPGLPENASQGLLDAMGWLTRAIHVKEIEAGESVGYGRRFTAREPTRVMTLPVGYADGYHRCIGGRGVALVRGRRAPVIGHVCMDQAMLDVTGIPGASVGDEVVLLGAQGDARITAREMGEWCGMIDYEVVLSPTSRVPRVYRR